MANRIARVAYETISLPSGARIRLRDDGAFWVLRRGTEPDPGDPGAWVTELSGIRIWSHLPTDPDEQFGWSVLAVESTVVVAADADGTPLPVTRIGNFHFTEFNGSPRVTVRSPGREDREVELRIPGYLRRSR